MKKGYDKSNEKVYKEIMKLVCGNYKMEEANFEDFMSRVIPQLPTKMKKTLDKYFGIDGGVNHYQKIHNYVAKGRPLNESELIMHREAMKVLRRLGTMDYLILFRKDVKDLMRKIAKKCYGEEDGLAKAKWAMLYGTIICGGPYFFCDREGVKKPIELNEESLYSICMIMLMEDEYKQIFESMPDEELIISVVRAWVEDLDVRDRVSILDFFGLKIPKYLKEFEPEELKSISLIRKLKERIFFNGPWATDGHLFTKTGILNQNVKKGFYEAFELLRRGAKITRSEPEEYAFGTGKRPISLYKIEGKNELHEFPYIEEIMFTFRWWNDTVCAS